MLRYLTAGESHGKCELAILEGMPAGLKLSEALINAELSRRLKGYGRGPRAKSIEKDKAQILSGLRKGLTLGSPISILIPNKDQSIDRLPAVTNPRPGHADLAGGLKYDQHDLRNILERASARETATRVAVGAACKTLLGEFRVKVKSRVLTVGGVNGKDRIHKLIDRIRREGNTLGGIFEVSVKGVVPGLGSHVHPDLRLDGQIAQAIMSIPSVKGVSIGLGFQGADLPGSEFHDEIFYSRNKGFFRKTNRAGGIEGGITNGEDIVVLAWIKPISTLTRPLSSVNIKSKKQAKASVERSDTCVVEAAGVVAEAALSFVLARAHLEKFGGDSMTEIKRNIAGYKQQIRKI